MNEVPYQLHLNHKSYLDHYVLGPHFRGEMGHTSSQGHYVRLQALEPFVGRL
jgi:hypothetical protein